MDDSPPTAATPLPRREDADPERPLPASSRDVSSNTLRHETLSVAAERGRSDLARAPRLLLPLGLAVCLSLFGDLTLYAVLPSFHESVGLSLAAVGVMLGVNRLIRIPGNPIAGALYDRLGRRMLFVVGMALGVLSTLAYGLVTGFVPFLLARLTWGVAWALLNVGGMTMIHDVSTLADRGRLSGAYNAWKLAGFAVGPLLGGFLVDLAGFRETMRLYAAVTAVGWLVALLALPETRKLARRDPTPGHPAPIARRTTPPTVGALCRRVVRLLAGDPRLRTILLLTLLFQFAGGGVALSTFNLLLARRFGAAIDVGPITLGIASTSGIIAALRSLVAGGAGPLAGRLADRRGDRTGILLTSLGLGMAGFALLSVGHTMALILLGVVISALSAGAGSAGLTATIGDLAPHDRRGLVIGAYATAGDVGATLGPLLAYALAATVPLAWAYGFCAVAFAAGWVLVRRVPTHP